MVTASAPGNVFLLGEHAVVYGKPALVAAVNLRCACTMERLVENRIDIRSMEVKNKSELRVLTDFCRYMLNRFGFTGGLQIRIESHVPVAGGLSSSTAVLCSILCAFSKLFRIGISVGDYSALVLPFQKIIHGGRASGAEIWSSAEGGYHYIARSVKKINNKELLIVIGDTGIRTKTAETVSAYIPERIARNAARVRDMFEKIGTLAKEGQNALQKSDLYRLGNCMRANQNILQALGLSHPLIDRAVEQVVQAGAYGAKLSGKGQGGIMFALVDDDCIERVLTALEKTGLRTMTARIGGKGAE